MALDNQAPAEPEHRIIRELEAPKASMEELAQQLAQDPEFRAWVGAELAGELAAKIRTTHS